MQKREIQIHFLLKIKLTPPFGEISSKGKVSLYVAREMKKTVS